MKTVKKVYSFFIAILFFITCGLYGMDDPFPFAQLSPEIQKYIILLTTKSHTQQFVEAENDRYTQRSLGDLAYTVNSIARVDKTRWAILNEPLFCLQLIKSLGQADCQPDATAVKVLKFSEAGRRAKIQNALLDLCRLSDPSKDAFDSVCAQGADLEFTSLWHPEECDSASPLMLSAVKSNRCMVEWLLEKKVNINQSTLLLGTTALMYADDSILPLLVAVPGININQQDKNGGTAIMSKVQADVPSPWGVQCLLSAGADPELGNPLLAAKKRLFFYPIEGQKIVHLLEDAIAKKTKKDT